MPNLIKYISAIGLISLLIPFEVSNSIGSNGMVVSSKSPATQIGIDILKNGGNAIDAAVGVFFSLAVTHPSAGNIGGGGFMVIRFNDGTVTTIDFREMAPSASYEEMFLDSLGNPDIYKSRYSSLSSGVPGSVYGLGYAHEKYGTMQWSSLLYPAINLAKYGFELDYHNSTLLNSDKYRSFLSVDEITKGIFFKDSPFKLKELFIQKDLSNTLSRIAKYGYKEFYNGLTSDYIIKCMIRTNGIITKDDLNNYRSIERKPIRFKYRDHIIYSMGLPSSGGITLANILNQVECMNLSSIPFHSSEHIHIVTEIEKRAYADRAEFLGDEDFINVPVARLISDDYALQRFISIDLDNSTNSFDINKSIVYDFESEETTHFSIVDHYGNAVSLTTTINGSFGNGIVVDNAGFFLNNEMDDFSIKPNFPNQYGLVGNENNAIEPGKRMLSSMSPTIVENKQGELYMVLGTPGGSTIITTVAQIIMNVIDYNMSLKEAVESKRFHHQWLPDFIQLEKRTLSKETLNSLSAMNHNFILRSSIGDANCIFIDSNKKLIYGVPDSRRGGHSLSY